MQNIISVKNITKSFGKVHALNGVSLEVEKGTVLGLLGPNGAGKTTLVRILTTLLQPDTGHIEIAGVDALKHPAEVRSRIGLAGQYAAVDENLTGKENLELVGRLYHLDWREVKKRSENLLSRFSLVDAANRTAKTYSGGMRRRLDLAASLVGEPEVLFLDEPTTGLDPRSRQELWEVLEELVKDGTTLLLTTQYLEEADYLANIIALIDKGGVIAQGTAKELKNNIGGGVLELHINDKEKIAEAALVLDKLFHTAPEVDGISGKIIIKETEGTKTLLEAVRAMDYFKIDIADIELRKPTLDEVFLTLTGKGKE